MNLLSFDGRMGRLRYLLALVVLLVPAGVLLHIGQTERQVWLYLAGLAMALATIFPAVQRLHDTGNNGWLAILAFVPGINFALGFYLLLWPGTAGPNAYGDPPGQARVRLEGS